MNYKYWFNQNRQTLAKAGHAPEEAAAELKLLLEYLANMPYSRFLVNGEDEINEDDLKKLDAAMEELMLGTPVDHIIGKRWFMGLEFEVDENTLIPRQETELLVEKAYDGIKADISESSRVPSTVQAAFDGETAAYRILDLCTGSGCIIVSLAKLIEEKLKYLWRDLSEKDSDNNISGLKIEYFASDISEKALKKASENAKKHDVRVKFILSDMFKEIDCFSTDNRVDELGIDNPVDNKANGYFDMIISNPPYISKAEMEKLDKKVSEHDPYAALYGGEDGLDFYRIIAKEAKSFLKPGGRLLMEIGYGQGESIKKLLEAEGYIDIEVLKDYSNLDRVIVCRVINNIERCRVLARRMRGKILTGERQ